MLLKMSRRSRWPLLTILIGILNICSPSTAYSNSIDPDISVEPPTPNITSLSKYFLEGESFSLNCTVTYQTNSPVILSWNMPPSVDETLIITETNEREVTSGILYNNITVINANQDHNGIYACVSKNNIGQRETTYEKIYKGKEGFIYMKKRNDGPFTTKQKIHRVVIDFDAYPPAEIEVLKDNELLNISKYKKSTVPYESLAITIYNLSVIDTGNYTVRATNKYLTNKVTYGILKKETPEIVFDSPNNKYYVYNNFVTLRSNVYGYPIPTIKCTFTTDKGEEHILKADNTQESLIKVISDLNILVRTSGNITCSAFNEMGNVTKRRNFLVYEIPGGFGITQSDKTWYPQNENVTKECYASVYDFDDVAWLKDGQTLENVKIVQNQFSRIAMLKLNNISLEDAGNYECVGIANDTWTEHSQMINITVSALKLPIITFPKQESNVEVNPYQQIKLTCQANAIPPPLITWYKDDKFLNNDPHIDILTEYLNDIKTIVNSTVHIKQASEEYKGKYECVATSRREVTKKVYHLTLNEKATNKSVYLSAIGIIVLVSILLIVYLTWKIRKEKQFRKELAAAGLLYFKEGVTRSLNPDLGIDEQAELLPYDEKFEFPAEKLVLGKQLGAGAFGVVYKAEARGILHAEVTTPVAVKMVKKTADNMYIKALASELKIMVHLGKHINIVNLLGACTKNVGKRELIVIVEYCMFGNIHNYMQRHREVFIDQLTDNKEKNLGRVNKAFSCSSGSSGMHSDYFGSNHTQNTDHTFVNTVNTNRSCRKVSDTGYVQPEWRSNYESDYSFDGRNPRPLYSRDLLAWAFQIARGMEYLANRKVLHGDLAARNVLLAEDNIVKICDFGLARSIYKNDEYKKQENSPLPVKWLAIECMTDRIFSTQSDVWSFGIVLWELFSLAKTPYPNVSPTNLIQWLSEGHRLEKPQYADDKLYGVMQRCWEQKPTARPNFGQLQEILGSFLDDNVRNHYVDLNSHYMAANVKKDGEDYLAMVCAPDYNNLVTPSPHHYANDDRNFFPSSPTPLQHDDEGYLQMSPSVHHSIFSPRTSSAKFDFDPRRLNPRASETSTELTPMLRSNDLPTRGGSESDDVGSLSPYLNMQPRIDEETDDVFEAKHCDIKNAHNTQNRAVTNPTYITFDVDLEKKPKNVSNNYNNVPNGLVK